MTHRWIRAFVLTLALGGVSPAFAATRLATFSWAPASGLVKGYAVFVTTAERVDELVARVPGTSAIVGVESGDSITIRVAALGLGGSVGPLSDPSTPVRLCPGDFDGDEVWGPEDWEDTRSCFGQAGSGFCAGADLDLDGIVSHRDLNAVKIGDRACAAETCPGDFDGDQIIGLGDLRQAQACFSQPVEGACVAGDMDGDGIISLRDVSNIWNSFGADACSL